MSVVLTNTGVTFPDATSQASAADPVPSGTVIYVAMSTAPTGYIKANGANVSRSTYANLFSAIGTTFGAGDGSTTFTLPDMRGMFPRGLDDGRGYDSGRALNNTVQGDAIRNITGNWNSAMWSAAWSAAGCVYGVYNGSREDNGGSAGMRAYIDASLVVPTAAENRPVNIALLCCIKY